MEEFPLNQEKPSKMQCVREQKKEKKKKRIIEEKPAFFDNLYNEDEFENTKSACFV